MTKDELQARVKKLEDANSDLARAAAQSIAAERAENDRLRDELFAATIAKAKADGYCERVNETDPITDRENARGWKYQPGSDDLASAFRRGAETAGTVARNFMNAEEPPWYQRGRHPDRSVI